MFKRIKTMNLIFLIIFLGIVFLLGSSFIKNVDLNSIKIENTNSVKKSKYFSSRDRAITEYLLSQKDFSWTTKEDSKRKCVYVNLKDNDLFPIEIWVHCIEYEINDSEINQLSGSSLPAVINYPNELSFFDPLKMTHIVPRDGSYWTKDVKDIFSKKAQERIFKKDFYEELNDLLKINLSNGK